MKAVIFDMDGLMFDTERVYIDAWNYAAGKMGLGDVGYMAIRVLGMNTPACERAWKDEFGEDLDMSALWGYCREFVDAYYRQYTVSVKKGLYDLLTYLKRKGYQLAVASSTQRTKVEQQLVSTKVRQYFDAVIGGDMVENSKPAPEIYLKAAAALGAKPEECYALEDSRNGLLAAYRAGCKAIHVPDLWQPDVEVKKFIIGPFDDLLQVRDWLISRE